MTLTVGIADDSIAATMTDRCVCGGASLSIDDIVLKQHGKAIVALKCIYCDGGRLLLKVGLMHCGWRHLNHGETVVNVTLPWCLSARTVA